MVIELAVLRPPSQSSVQNHGHRLYDLLRWLIDFLKVDLVRIANGFKVLMCLRFLRLNTLMMSYTGSPVTHHLSDKQY